MKQLILASSSPSRKKILELLKIPFMVDASNYQEDMTLKLEPKDLAKHLSLGKAQDTSVRHHNAVVLGADSFAVSDGRVLLGKPHTREQAKKTLMTLSGRAHSFITGFTIIDTDTRKQFSDVVETRVYFRKLTTAEIDSYLDREDVLERAGAYIIQGLGIVLIDKIEGSYSNVMGLPISQILVALKRFNIKLL